MKLNLHKAGDKLFGAVGMVLIALLIGGVLVMISGNSMFEAYGSLISGAFGSKQRISELFVKLVPVMIMALGVSIAYRAQLWNIGATGQFLMGSIAACAVGHASTWLLDPRAPKVDMPAELKTRIERMKKEGL